MRMRKIGVDHNRPGLGMNMGDGDLLLIVLLRPLRKVRSPSRNV